MNTISSLSFQDCDMFISASEYTNLECPVGPLSMERKWEPKIEVAPNCPRCASSNTKFCYYNNYSLSQPRYFCKGCKRYWTKGGSLRNVPVGGGCRKSRRAKSARGSAYARQAPSSDVSTIESQNATNGPEIDMAAVFTKYLSQDLGSEDKGGNDQESSGGTCSGSVDLELKSGDTDAQFEDLMLQFGEEIPQVSVGENVEDLLELQSMLGDDEIGTSLQNFSWQPMVQLEDFGSSISTYDHNLKISSNVSCENWSSSFDLSGYEIFSGP